MRGKWLVLCVVVLAVVGLSGCGSNSGSGGSEVSADVDAVTSVGLANCVKCHSAATAQTYNWLRGSHGNSNLRPSSLHGEGSSCQPCHNQKLENENLSEIFPPEEIGTDRNGNPVYADQNRDVIACESCHGDGSAHRGIGPIPVPRPDWEQCTQCHDHAEGVRHADDYGLLASSVGASAHNNSDDLHASTTRCQRCHTAEGSVALARFTGDADVMHLMDDLEPIASEEELHAVTCATCHVPHKDEGRWESFIENDNDLAEGNWDPNGNGVADQFDFCTSCHTYYNQDGVLIGSGSEASGTAPHYHNTAWYRVIPTTHYDDPATGYGMDVSRVEGYVIRENGDSPCFDCHGHEFRTNTRRSRDIPDPDDNAADYGYTIHTEWASSGHAGGLLKAKYAADSGSRSEENVDNVMMAGASDETSGGGFTHYDWDAANRQSCQMCHTATGFSNYVADPASYDAANNDFSHLAGWTPGGASGQNELLYCWGCHENAATGVLRVTGAVTAVYTYNDQPVVFPDVGASNTCVVCHSGRGNNEEASTSSRFAGHHAPAAADLFSEYSHVAYEYPGLDYSNPLREDGSPFFVHDTIGVDSGQGPCVSCHMADNANHTFAAVEKDENGLITDVLNKSLCDTCHTPGASYEITAAKLEEEAEGYKNAGELVQDLINQENGLSNYTGAVINNSNELENDRGAFQNAKLPTEEPGGFAHNRYYVKRAIFDAIDWVDNGVLDGTIADYSATYPEATHWLGTTRP